MFLHALVHVLASLWPLLPVILGAVLLRSALTDKVKALPVSEEYFRNKYFQNGPDVDFGVPRSTSR